MSAINEANLPGVGRKLWMESASGGRISIIAFNTGEYEVYLTPKGEQFPTSAVHLTPGEARALGSAFPAASEDAAECPMPDAACVVVPADSPALGEDAVSLKHGTAFVMAVEAASEGVIRPPGGHALHPADMLYLMGADADREVLARKIQPHG